MFANHRRFSLLALAVALLGGPLAGASAQKPAPKTAETIGGGTVAAPAVGPKPSFGIGGPGMVLVKNWHFGTQGTIKNYADMSANFVYHDQFGTIGNGTNYGAVTVAPNAATALPNQPIEGVDSPPVRQFNADSIKTFLTGLDGATQVKPQSHNAGNGSFMAQWKLPKGGSLLGQDIVWETRVRYVTPPISGSPFGRRATNGSGRTGTRWARSRIWWKASATTTAATTQTTMAAFGTSTAWRIPLRTP